MQDPREEWTWWTCDAGEVQRAREAIQAALREGEANGLCGEESEPAPKRAKGQGEGGQGGH